MKTFAVTIGAVAAIALLIVLFPNPHAGDEPRPIKYGEDTCARCRMHITARGFAGEMRDVNGAFTKYDDLGCLITAMWKQHREVPDLWAEEHETGSFIPLLSATLVVDSEVETPMGFRIIAFDGAERARAFIGKHGGRIETLERLLDDGPRFRAKLEPRASREK